MAQKKITYIDSKGSMESINFEVPVQIVQLGRVDDNLEVVRTLTIDGKGYTTIEGCVPDNPFYVRWINNLGGYDYKMFSRRKAISEEITGIVNAQTAPVDPFDTQETIDAEGVVLVTTGEDGLPRKEYDTLLRLARSPRIQWWNEEQRRWHTIVLQKESKNLWDTESGLGSIEFTFQMPRIKMQF